MRFKSFKILKAKKFSPFLVLDKINRIRKEIVESTRYSAEN